jgi:hypothetical protein
MGRVPPRGEESFICQNPCCVGSGESSLLEQNHPRGFSRMSGTSIAMETHQPFATLCGKGTVRREAGYLKKDVSDDYETGA